MSVVSPEPRGALELTWTNKHLRLLAKDGDSYEWTEASDHRVAEVRLLRSLGSVGVDTEGRRNLLIRGDALHALKSLARLPELSSEYLGKVRLVYMDPPFNTGQAFTHYDDALEHSVWLTMMRDRLEQIRLLLDRRGSVWIHLDDAEMAYCRVIADEIFGRDAFIASVVWEKTYTPKSNGRGLSTDHDYILVYAKNREAWLEDGWNLLDRNEEQTARFSNPDNDTRGPWRTYPLDVRTDNSARRESYRYEVVTPSGRAVRPSAGRHWSLPLARFEEERAAGNIFFGKKGDAMPTKKMFLTEARQGVLARTWWPHTEVGSSQEAKKEAKLLAPTSEPFATPKPERLLRRIIEIATDPGDLVLDCFAGSGSSLAVAQKLDRSWVGIEWSGKTFSGYTLPRLEAVVDGTDGLALTGEVAWTGGGGFDVLEVAPSMWDVVGGRVVLADWATGGELAKAIAAQDGWTVKEDAPFSGHKASIRYAVLDGLVTTDIALMLAGWLEAGETLVVYGTAIDPAAGPALRKFRKGSEVRPVPQAILASYRRQWRKEQVSWIDVSELEPTEAVV